MITYRKLFAILKDRKITFTELKRNKVLAQETYEKMKKGTGVYATGRLYGTTAQDYTRQTTTATPDQTDTPQRKSHTHRVEANPDKPRIASVDTRSIENICVYLDVQPSDIMEVIPNRWDKADALCTALDCTIDELADRLPMEGEKPNE